MMARFPHPARPGRRLIRIVIFAIVIAALSLPIAATAASAATTCDRVFTGNSTGSRDVTSSLTSFLRHHGGKRLCLRTNGTYRVNGTIRLLNVSGLSLNGRNATIRAYGNASVSAQRNQLRIEDGRNISIRNLKVRGSNADYTHWNESRQQEHGVAIYGGSTIRLTHVSVRNTYGDGIYISYIPGVNNPASGVTMSHVSVARAGRSGVAIVAGDHMIVSRSTITETGMHSVNIEPDTSDAAIHHVTVQYSKFSAYGRSDAWNGYAFNAYAWVGSLSAIRVIGNRAPTFHASVLSPGGGTYTGLTFSGNVSTYRAQATFENVVGLTFSGNVRITKYIE